MQERKFNETTVKDQIKLAIDKTNPQEEPEKYLNLLDEYEVIDLREKQHERREKLLGKIEGNDRLINTNPSKE